MIIKLDIDGVLRDQMTALREQYLKDFPSDKDKLKPVTAWGVHEFFPIGKNIYDYWFKIRPKETFEDAPAFSGAVDFVRELRSRGHFVVLTTTQPRGDEGYTVNWIIKNGIEYDGIFFIEKKQHVAGDVLLDDAEHNLENEKNGCVPVCFDQPWNQGWGGKRVKTYPEFLALLETL